MQPLHGKGMSIWKIAACEGGEAAAIAKRAQDSGIRHVHIKVADGTNPSNGQPASALPKVVAALKQAGIQVWGWHFLYGIRSGQNQAKAEADRAIAQIKALGLDGYALDFENTGNPQFTWNGAPAVATTFMNTLRAGVGADYPVAAKSHALITRFGTDNIPLQPQVPFDAFVQQCNYLIPQVYWVFDTPERRLRESFRQYTSRWPDKVFAPYGAAYGEKQGNGKFWEATPDEIRKFMDVARELDSAAVAFYSWDYAGLKPALWDAIASYDWPAESGLPPQPPPGGIQPEVLPSDRILELFDALNARNVEAIVALYSEQAAYVTARQTVQGHAAIRAAYTNFLNTLPDARFTVLSAEDVGITSGHFKWSATSSAGNITNGEDTLGLFEGLIINHSTTFTLTA